MKTAEVPEIPGVVLKMIGLFQGKVKESAIDPSDGLLSFERLFPPDSDPANYLIGTVRKNELVAAAALDLRKFLIAYAHGVSDPRPSMRALAQASHVSLGALTRRYSEGTLKAVEGLIAHQPDIDLVLKEFASLNVFDLALLGGEIALRTYRHESDIADCVWVETGQPYDLVPAGERRYLDQFSDLVRQLADNNHESIWKERRSFGLTGQEEGPRWLADAWVRLQDEERS